MCILIEKDKGLGLYALTEKMLFIMLLVLFVLMNTNVLQHLLSMVGGITHGIRVSMTLLNVLMKFDMVDLRNAKPGDVYLNRLGHTVRIICTDRKDTVYNVVGLVRLHEQECIETYTANGKWYNAWYPSEYDLVERIDE